MTTWLTSTRAALAALAAGTVLLMASACSPEEPGDPSAAPSPETASVAPATADNMQASPGVYDDRVVFGQSAAFSGPAQALGQAMRMGIEAAFNERNAAGGVHGRMLELVAMDDRYEPGFAYANTSDLIAREQVFGLIGAVGTPTSRSAAPLADSEAVPFLAPFTGAGFLRNPELKSVVNLRASYAQETEHMVERLTVDLGVTRVAVMYQNDSYGQSGLTGVLEALDRRGLEPVATWYYERNSTAVKAAVYQIAAANPEAVIMIGAYQPVARAVSLLRVDIDPIFLAVSFVGGNALARELGDEALGVFVTQVVPAPDDAGTPVVAEYLAALDSFDADAEPGFVSLEGYLAGRLAIFGLESCEDLTRGCFLAALQESQSIDLSGMRLQYGPGDNQGSDEVIMTMIDEQGRLVQVTSLDEPL
ncbi:MAG: ABC transporter substrate-binding protein [Gemmatimonadetes bacterium]|nr:ABC transporter substrate-binding protein [Gemmatimonadota bacterium]MYG22653.1 ABC transporter substrate-binding protein [Gemmatimonadota bacterium]MYJ39146.1 ABC transporter substrate-binding protein [Gemmatimonadota bacterium]